jgi:hypothetical protein
MKRIIVFLIVLGSFLIQANMQNVVTAANESLTQKEKVAEKDFEVGDKGYIDKTGACFKNRVILLTDFHLPTFHQAFVCQPCK